MTDKDYYEKLLKEMKSAVNNLNSANSEIDNLISKLNQGLSINDVGYKTSDLEDMKIQIEEYCNKLNNSIIPAIEKELEDIEDEED